MSVDRPVRNAERERDLNNEWESNVKIRYGDKERGTENVQAL